MVNHSPIVAPYLVSSESWRMAIVQLMLVARRTRGNGLERTGVVVGVSEEVLLIVDDTVPDGVLRPERSYRWSVGFGGQGREHRHLPNLLGTFSDAMLKDHVARAGRLDSVWAVSPVIMVALNRFPYLFATPARVTLTHAHQRHVQSSKKCIVVLTCQTNARFQ